MRPTIRLLLLLAGAAWSGSALAQTPTLEFFAGASNPTGSGPTKNAQVITFQNNTDNPTSSAFVPFVPTTRATFALSAQKLTNGLMFGGNAGGDPKNPAGYSLFVPINSLEGSASGNYTSANSVSVGTGIDVATNRSVELYTSVDSVITLAEPNTRYQYADLTITFNQPVVNPVVHVTGLGFSSGTTNYFTTELDLVTTGVTLSKLSGSSALSVQTSQILNGATNPTTTGASTASGSVLVTTPAGGITSLLFRVYLRTGNTVTATTPSASSGDNWLLAVSQLTPTVVTGYVYEDVNYGGGLGRPRSASGTATRPGATVELYTSAGEFVATTTTDATGQYAFNVPAGPYVVRVVNSTVTSSRPGAVAGLLPVQTYNGTTSRVGGENPAGVDAAANSGTQTLAALSNGTPESIAPLTVTGSTTAGPDFGFNFDLVVNTRDAGQGSLRQFILNSNTLTNAGLDQVAASAGGPDPVAGVETSLFMIPDGLDHDGLLATANGGPSADPNFTSVMVGGVTQKFVSIAPASALDAIADAGTSIDGTTQTINIGNTNNVTLGTGGTVGTAGTALGQLNGREVQLVGSRSFNGLTVSAASTTVRGLSIYGFIKDILVGATSSNVLIERNVLGASATSFTDPGTNARSTQEGVFLNNSTNGIVRNNLIGFNGGTGVELYGDGSGANNNTVSGNESRGNGQEITTDGEGLVSDGLELRGASTGNTISGNLITSNLGHGIDTFGNDIGGNTITGNTLSNNGQGAAAGTGAEGSGLRVYSATNKTTIANNVLSGNNGSGVLVAAAANNVTISQNSAFGNTRLAIDLLSTADGSTTATTYNGATGTASNVSLNDNGDGDTGGNGLLNFPVLTSATFVGTNLVLQGYARPGSVIELFTASTTPNGVATNVGFGQSQAYLGTFTEGSAADSNPSAGSYSGSINGLFQGTDATNLFTFTIPLTGNFAGLATGTVVLTSTATLTNSTSEFSGNITVRPTANNDFATTTVGTAVTFAVTANDTPGNLDNATIDLDPNTAGIQTSYTVAGQGTFTTVGVTAGLVKFTPVDNIFTGTVTIPYVVSTTATPGLVSNQASLSVYVAPSLDLATTLASSPASGPIASSSAVTYTVTSTNNSALTANNVVATLQLPASLTSNGGTVTITSATGSGTYNNTTGVVTFATTTLAANTSATYTVAVSKVPTSGAIAATSTITSTGNGQEPNTNNNVATVSLSITPWYDVTTTLAGPVDATGTAVAVVTGDLVTYAVQTTNATTALSAAPSVVQTVSFDGDLTTNGLFISNGGTAVYNATAQKTIVTFPALLTLAAGQSVLNTISFIAPSSAYNATATVTANSNNTGDTSSANNTSATLATSVKSATGGSTNVSTTISADIMQANPSDAVTLTIVTANAGPSEATNVVQQVQLPAGLNNVTFPNGNGTYNTTTGLVTFNTLSALSSGSSNGPVLAGAATANPNAFRVQFDAPAAGIVLATAFVTEDNNDLVPADNVAEVKVNVNSLTDLATEVEGPITATVGQPVTYSIVTSNLSATAASNVVERVQLPPNLGPGSITFGGPATGSYDNATGVVTFLFSDGVPAGSRLTNTVAFTMPASTITDPAGTVVGGNMLAVAVNVRTATPESNVANNTALVATTIVPTADVRVSLSGPSTTLIGSPATYVVTITNDGAATVASVLPTLSLPAGLTSNSGVVTITGGGTYDNTTGLVTFPTLTNLTNGSSNSNTVTVTTPDVSAFTPVAQVQVSAATIDRDLSNNRAQLTAYPATPTAPTADLSAALAITTGSATPEPNAPITLTASFANATGVNTASQVVPHLTLPAGLLANGPVTVGNSGAYDNATGLVTWPTVATLAAGASLPGSYTISFIAPSGGLATATAYVASSTSDATPTNNAAAVTLNVTQETDITTNVSLLESNVPVLPGSRVTYTVVTTNAGPSPAVNDVTQQVRLPAGLDLSMVSYPAGSTISADKRTITLPIIKGLGVGSVVNYVSFNAPSATFSVIGQVNMTDDFDTFNNSAPTNTTVNRAPVAYNVVNTMQSPQGSSADALLLSPLVANDADASSTFTYRITSLPSPATGVLTLNGTAITTTTALSSDDVKSLYFNPVGTASNPTAYVGNTFFSYIAIDNLGAVSAPALYTIVVGKDNVSQYNQVYAPGKVYQNGDVVANVLDSNTARYNSSGQVYSDANGAIVATNGSVSNGLTSAVAATSTDAATLADNGLALNPTTGQVTVLDNTKLPTGPLAINITTTDANGGVSTVLLTLRLTVPLPVVLTTFTAQAVANRDALLNWGTASEAHNDHFEVERSFDGNAFSQIGRLAGHGTTSAASAYTFTDAGIGRQVTKPVYYRLRQVDVDGKTTYSPVRSVSFAPAALVSLSLYPNPTADRTSLDLSQLSATTTVQVQLLDAPGRTVLSWTLTGGQVQPLDVQTLAAGTYLLLVNATQPNGSPLHQVLRLTKE
ncbi:MAG: right-handed parallel beta-helix repeat-containing protein [Janthinobacterium lividum]